MAEKKDGTGNLSGIPRILAYGDSLTDGFSSGGTVFTPYAETLQSLLGQAAEVDHIGLSGWTTHQMVEGLGDPECVDACGKLWPGLRRALAGARRAGRPYALVLLLAGTNDLSRVLGGVYSQDSVLDNLKLLHSTAHDHQAQTAAITIPESFAEKRWQRAKEIREQLNESLKGCVSEWNDNNNCGSDQRRDFQKSIIIDLDREFKYFDLSMDERQRFWDDGLHFTPDGYKKMANICYPKVKEILNLSS